MIPVGKCSRCGNELEEKVVEKLLRGGDNFAAVTVTAEVYRRCGEYLYSMETVKLFEKIRHKLANQDVDEFEPLGHSFQVLV